MRDHLTLESRIEYILNQLIEHLKIPLNKFSTTSSSSKSAKRGGLYSSFMKSPASYKVTFKNLKFDFEYDDEYIDFEEFERWSMNDLAKNKTPSLK